MKRKAIVLSLLALVMALCLSLGAALGESVLRVLAAEYPVQKGGEYSSMEEVAVYLTLYGELPDNYITKSEADRCGWKTKGDLDEVAPGCSIGGDHFGNYENQLPVKKGRKYTECDIDYVSGSRGAKRLIFSNDGLMYYTSDHYSSFTPVEVDTTSASAKPSDAAKVKKSGKYTSKNEVAAYLHQYGKLPSNYLTKNEAKKLGWSNKKNNLGDVAPDCAIGGDSYGNREGRLPDADGRKWYECDVNVTDGKRSDDRIVYSNDGLVYFTNDGHKTFTQLY